MSQTAYQGQVSYSSSAAKAVDDSDSDLAPADRNDYNPASYTSEPGAAARAKGYPRQDGRPN